MEAEISRHGYRRSRERIKLNKSGTENLAKKALENGISHQEAQGSLKRYFDSVFLQHMKGNNIRIYAEKVFVFDENFLITVFHLPSEMKKLAMKAFKKRKQIDH